jgi:peroxiredoxin
MKYIGTITTTIAILAILLSVSTCSPSPGANTITLGTVTSDRIYREQTLVKNAPAPDFQLQMPDGNIIFLSELRGKVVLLNFWAINCPYCVKEMPFLQKAQDEFSAENIVILGINTGESETKVTKFVTDNKLTFPIILDPNIYASSLYKIRYLPTTYLIDKTGNIQITKIGAFQNADEIITAIESLLQ